MARQKWDKRQVDVQWVIAHWLQSDEGDEWINKYFAGIVPQDREAWEAMLVWIDRKKGRKDDKD